MSQGSNFSYIFILLAGLAGLITLISGTPANKVFLSRKFQYRALALFVFWASLDYLAIRIGAWSFPKDCCIPVRILGLPLEEYLLFYLHSVATLFIAFLLLPQANNDE